ncbi:MAG TPA: thioredoxin [Verrucomicrobiae bacterium]
MNSIIFYILAGGGLGALLGYSNRCRSGACPLTANWRRGAVYGAMLAAVFYSVAGCGGDSTAMNQSSANVKHITDTDFDAEVTQSVQPVVVDCYATWCGPCRQLAPIVDKLADTYAGKIKFVKVNVDESPKTAQKFQVDAIPRLLFFKDGKLADSTVGLLSKKELIARLDALLAAKVQPAAPAK